jgi:hypothetical protein
VIVGNNLYADNSVLGVRSTVGAPTTIPDTAILPNRPQLITAVAGSFDASASPTFSYRGVQLLGPTLLVPTPPPAAPAGGAESEQA